MAIRQTVFGPVSKGMGPQGEAEGTKHRFMGDPAEGQQGRPGWQFRKLANEVSVAGTDLRPRRLVGRWQTLDGVCDPAVDEFEAIVGGTRFGAARETEAMHGLVEDDAGMVPREGPPRRIGAMQARRQTDDQEPRPLGPEGRYRQGMVVGIALADLIEMGSESGTVPTGQNRRRWTRPWHDAVFRRQLAPPEASRRARFMSPR